MQESSHVTWNLQSLRIFKVNSVNIYKRIYHGQGRKNLRVEVLQDLLEVKFNSNINLSYFQNQEKWFIFLSDELLHNLTNVIIKFIQEEQSGRVHENVLVAVLLVNDIETIVGHE